MDNTKNLIFTAKLNTVDEFEKAPFSENIFILRK